VLLLDGDVGRVGCASEIGRSKRATTALAVRYDRRWRNVMEHVEGLLKTTLGEIERLLNTRTVVGEPISVEGNTVIPLISIGFGFGAGGGSGKETKTVSAEGYGGGSGGGGGIKPVAIIVVDKNGVRVEPIRRGAASVIEKAGEAIGRIVEKRADKKA